MHFLHIQMQKKRPKRQSEKKMEGYGNIAFFFLQVQVCQSLRKPEKSQDNAGAGGARRRPEKYAKICMPGKLWYTDTRTEQKQRPAFLGGRTVRSVRVWRQPLLHQQGSIPGAGFGIQYLAEEFRNFLSLYFFILCSCKAGAGFT